MVRKLLGESMTRIGRRAFGLDLGQTVACLGEFLGRERYLALVALTRRAPPWAL